jgi:hypothetical protein
MLKNLSIVLLSSGMLAACGGGGSSSPSASLTDALETTCAKIFECKDSFPGDQAQFTMVFGTSAGDCVTKLGPTAAEKKAFDASVSAGRIKFNESDADKCIAANSKLTCPQLWGTEQAPDEPACDTAVQGQVAVGGTCTLSTDSEGMPSDVGDCVDGASCDEATMKCVMDQAIAAQLDLGRSIFDIAGGRF